MDELRTTLSILLGTSLGAVFFGGLWATVSILTRVSWPGVWTLASLLLRFGLTIAGLSLIAQHWGAPYLLAALVGLLLSRRVVRVLVERGGWSNSSGDTAKESQS